VDNQTETDQELKKLYRFFHNRVSKYIFLVIDDERILNYLIIRIQVELRTQKREILHFSLTEETASIYDQVRHFLEQSRADGLIVTHLNRLIYRNPKECINKLNKARDAFERFHIPIIFTVNRENLKKIIVDAPDFYQLRDLPDFHFKGSQIRDRDMMNLNIEAIERYPDADLKADLLNRQLAILKKEDKIDEKTLNSVVMPLLDIYAAQHKIDKMTALFNQYVQGHESQVKDPFILGNYYYKNFDFNNSQRYYQEALNEFDKSGDQIGLANAYRQIGKILLEIGQYKVALEYFQKSLKISEQLDDKKGISDSLNQIGRLYQDKGNYDGALNHYEKVLEIAEKIEYTKGISASLNNIGNIHYLKGEHVAALKYYEKSLELKEKISDFKGITSSLHNIGAIYYDKNNYNAAVKQFKKSLTIAEKIRDIKMVAINLNEIGKIHFAKNEYADALRFYIKAFLTFSKFESPRVRGAKDNILEVREKMGKDRFEEILRELNIEAAALVGGDGVGRRSEGRRKGAAAVPGKD
jgi:tetratricopeptide (TPR) repeat protein